MVPYVMQTIECTIYVGNKKIHTAIVGFAKIDKFGQIWGPNTMNTFENFD